MVVSVAHPRVFSTAGVPGGRQVELWEHHNADALIALNCRPLGAATLTAVEVNVQLDQVHLARVRGSAHVVDRPSTMIDARPADALAVYVTLRGTASFEQAGERRTLRPGQVLMYDPDQPFTRGFAAGLEELVVKLPWSGPRLDRPVVTDTTDAHVRALAALVDRATRPHQAVPADERALVELVQLLAGLDGDPAPAHRAAARAFIETHLADQGLSAATVADAVGISERHLSRVFAADGTSLPRYVLARRLNLAHAVLAAGTRRSVGEVAAQCGFTSGTYFSNTFRTHFGVRAGDLRRAASDFRHPGHATPPTGR